MAVLLKTNFVVSAITEEKAIAKAHEVAERECDLEVIDVTGVHNHIDSPIGMSSTRWTITLLVEGEEL